MTDVTRSSDPIRVGEATIHHRNSYAEYRGFGEEDDGEFCGARSLGRDDIFLGGHKCSTGPPPKTCAAHQVLLTSIVSQNKKSLRQALLMLSNRLCL